MVHGRTSRGFESRSDRQTNSRIGPSQPVDIHSPSEIRSDGLFCVQPLPQATLPQTNNRSRWQFAAGRASQIATHSHRALPADTHAKLTDLSINKVLGIGQGTAALCRVNPTASRNLTTFGEPLCLLDVNQGGKATWEVRPLWNLSTATAP